MDGIARRYNTSSSSIRDCNGLSSSVVRAGQHLQVPGNTDDAEGSRRTRGGSSQGTQSSNSNDSSDSTGSQQTRRTRR